MDHVPSEQSIYIESDDEDNSVYGSEVDEEESHIPSDNDENQQPNSYTTTWPQSFGQTIGLYSDSPSPNTDFLEKNPLIRFGSSFLSSTLRRRNTPESLSEVIRRNTPESLAEVTKHLLPLQEADEISSNALLSNITSVESPIQNGENAPLEVHSRTPGNSSYGHAVLNGMNVLCGVGILSTPYATKEGGWLGLIILFSYGIISFYTGLLLRYCLDSNSTLKIYPDIGEAAFGTNGRICISIVLYLELYACCVEYIILESANLSSWFPNAALSIGGFELDARHLFALLTTLLILPTVIWIRDLSILSYISAGGVIASVLVVLCLFWIGFVDEVGVHSKGTPLNLSTLPVAIGLYGYCYSGHAVFPKIYTSMANPDQYPAAIFTCFGVCTLMYAAVAARGYTMFGEATQSPFTLNLPQNLVATKIAVWTTVVNPLAKYALVMSPVADCLEELLPSRLNNSYWYPIAIRTALVFSTLFVGLAIPFFGLVMSLIGSLLTMLVTLILPPACFLSISRGNVTRTQLILCVLIIIVGAISSVIGSYSAVSKIIERLSD